MSSPTEQLVEDVASVYFGAIGATTKRGVEIDDAGDRGDASQVTLGNQGLSDCKLTPLGQGGGSALFENVAAIEMAWVVEMVVDRGMDGGECLQGLDVSEPSHCPFPPSKGLM